jgi:ADP-heptose:LPS heptosyltransferase
LRRSIKNDLKPINVLDVKFFEGGLGDSIARLPAIVYILQHCPHVKSIRLFAQDYFREIVEHLFPVEQVKFVGYSQIKEELKRQPSEAYMGTDIRQHSTLHTHLTHHAFHTIVDTQPMHISSYNYPQLNLNILPTKLNLLNKSYAVITTGFTAPVREWLPSEINKVAQWFNLKGITPVFLGKKQNEFREGGITEATFSEGIDYSLGINLIDSTSLLEAAKIMAGAKVVVGIDNGLLHLAGMTQVPIVAGYTSVSAYNRMPIRNGMIGWNTRMVTPSVGCSPCQSQALLHFNFDYRTCYYGDYACIPTMTAQKFIKELEFVCH